MKRYLPFLLVCMVAACTPRPQPPAQLEPVAPATEAPATGTPAEAPTTAAEPLPEEPAVVVTPAEPGGLPEVPPLTASAPEAPAAPETETAEAETTEAETSSESETTETETSTEGETASGGATTDATSTPRLAPQGIISISADNQTFATNEAEELNAVTVPAGATFYLKLEFSDPDGITEAEVQLRNSAAAGTLPTGPFTVTSSDCEAQLASTPTDLTCTLEVSIAADAQNIAEAGETAYAFRPSVTDALGNTELSFSWGYLIVEPQ